MFRARVLIIRRSKLYYTASGIITPIGGRTVHRSSLNLCTGRHRCDETRCCVMQFWPPDDEHMCSKHVEAWNKLIVKQKFCASSWLITEINTLRCTVIKTSKLSLVIIFYAKLPLAVERVHQSVGVGKIRYEGKSHPLNMPFRQRGGGSRSTTPLNTNLGVRQRPVFNITLRLL